MTTVFALLVGFIVTSVLAGLIVMVAAMLIHQVVSDVPAIGYIDSLKIGLALILINILWRLLNYDKYQP